MTVVKQSRPKFQSLDKLRTIGGYKGSNFKDDGAVTRRPPQPQPEPIVFNGKLNEWYSTVRNGTTHKVFLVEVRKDTVIYKDSPEDKHSSNMSLAKFVKFYK